MQITQELAKTIQGEVTADPTVLDSLSRDASLFQVTPKIAVYPKSSQDIQKLVGYVNNHAAEKLSLTVRSGGTDMTGGPLNESIIVNTTRHLNHIKKIENHSATVEPGVYYRDFEAAAKKQNLLLPSYPASKEICTLGGMVSNNSGGEKSLNFGQTKKYISHLKVVVSSGDEVEFKALTTNELEQKKQLQTREGDIYRQMFSLVSSNYELLQKAKPNVSKNSTGYHLWDIWDKNTFDLTQLFAASQGTLGIITEIGLRLVTPKPYTQLLVIFLDELTPLAQLVQIILPFKPESFESYDDHTLRFALKFWRDIMQRLGSKNFLSMIWQFLPEFRIILRHGFPKLVLLAEFAGDNPEAIRQQITQARQAVSHLPVTTRIVANPNEAAKYWTVRRESFNLLRHHVQGKRTAPFIDDIIVHPGDLPKFLPELDEILSHYRLVYTIAGHIGDANFHIIPLMNIAQPESRKIIPELAGKVYELVKKYNGSISGEHNDGLIRSPYLEKMYGPQVYKLFAQTKTIFDPNNIFNPGKKIGASLDYALAHMVEH